MRVVRTMEIKKHLVWDTDTKKWINCIKEQDIWESIDERVAWLEEHQPPEYKGFIAELGELKTKFV